MPYSALSDLPDAVKKMPKHAQEIYLSAFNSAFKLYDGNEGKAHGTAWAAVKKVYKQNEDGTWVAKESNSLTLNQRIVPSSPLPGGDPLAEFKEVIMATKLSDENKRTILQTALVTEYKIGVSSPIPKSLVIDEIYEDRVIFNIDGQLYESTYELDATGKASFGEPKKVLATKVFKAMESLQSTYAEIIQEAGKRNAGLDSGRIKKIVELCQELLSSEAEPEERKAKETLKEAASVLKWIKEQAVMKTEDGMKFPAAAYAYVGDPEKSTTWKLRLWEDLEKKVTRAQLGRAAAALSPGGFRGQKVAIPSADLSAVKRKIRAEYRKLDVEDEDIPRWVKEAETREIIQNYEPLTEAKFDKGRATVIVIRPGFNATEDRYYPAEVLKRDYGIFEGQKMYADHPTEEEDKARPERSIRDWVATLTEVKCDDNGVITGIAEIVEPWLMQKLASLRDKDMLSEMGISINAVGSASKGTIEGKETLVIEKLVASRSVDFVTEPGAGGVVTLYEADRNHDIDLVELAILKEKRPDLIKAIEANVRAKIQTEVKKQVESEERIKELEGEISTLTTERDTLKEAAEKAEKEKARAEAQATIKEAVEKAELPGAAKEQLLKRFENAESADEIKEAIKTEIDYIARLSETVKVKGLGPSQPNTESDEKALRESLKKANPEWSDEQLDEAVRGR